MWQGRLLDGPQLGAVDPEIARAAVAARVAVDRAHAGAKFDVVAWLCGERRRAGRGSAFRPRMGKQG
jgi:hypothetical protein